MSVVFLCGKFQDWKIRLENCVKIQTRVKILTILFFMNLNLFTTKRDKFSLVTRFTIVLKIEVSSLQLVQFFLAILLNVERQIIKKS